MRLFTRAGLAAAGLLLSFAAQNSTQAQSVRRDPPPIDPPGPGYCPIPRMLAGEIDSCYGYFDHGFGIGVNGQVNAVKMLATGKTLIAGAFTTYNGQVRHRICRVKADGGVDSTFLTGTGFDGEVLDMAVQPNGRIVAVGNFTGYNGTPRAGIARLLPDGEIDNSFASATGFAGEPRRLVLAPDGRMLVQGAFTAYAGRPRRNLARLHADGRLDTAFVPADTVQPFSGMALMSAGRVAYSYLSAALGGRLAVLGSTGAIDTSFTPAPLGSGYYKLQVLPGDTVLALSRGQAFSQPVLLKLNPDGTRTGGFGTVFPSNGPMATDVIQDEDGRLVLSFQWNWESNTQSTGLVRLFPNGSRDSSLAPFQVPAPVYAFDLAKDGSGRIAYSGYSNAPSARGLQMAFATGQPDLDFNVPEHFNGPINQLLEVPGNMALALGNFTMVLGEEHPGAMKMTPKGNRHPDFYIEHPVYSAIMQPDTLVLGLGSKTPNIVTPMLYRFSKNGQLLDSADLENVASSFYTLVPFRNQGKGLVVGQRSELHAVQPDGRTDTTLLRNYRGFMVSPPLPFDPIFNDVLSLPDGRIVLAGGFAHSFSKLTAGLALMDSTGTVDTTFYDRVPLAIPYPLKPLQLVRRQADGKLLVAGANMRLKDGRTFAGLLRLNADGSLDNSFVLRPLVDSATVSFTALAVDPAGRIYVAGDGKNYETFERLNADGSHDSTFIVPGGVEGTVRAILPNFNQPTVLVAGDVTRIANKPRSYLAQLFTEGLRVAVKEDLSQNLDPKTLRLAPNPASGLVRVETTAPAQLFSIDGRLLQSARPQAGTALFNLSALKPGLYLVRSGGRIARVVKN